MRQIIQKSVRVKTENHVTHSTAENVTITRAARDLSEGTAAFRHRRLTIRT